MILLIDNYDSFVFNLARYFEQLGQATRVVRNEAIDADGIRQCNPSAIVLSPGPCGPSEAGASLEIVREFWQSLPILGICLGHQTIAAAFGAKIVRAREPMHGRTSAVIHDGQGVYSNLPCPLVACRYHSLVVDEETLPADFEISARTADEVVMSIRHRERPLVGVQFHPESILTDSGYDLLANFLRLAGLDCPATIPTIEGEFRPSASDLTILPDQPVTF